jgi:glycosyltransferase involved in cell wall biosynthesis
MISGCAVNVLRNLDPDRFEGRLWASHALTREVRYLPEVNLTIPPFLFRGLAKLPFYEQLACGWSEYRFLSQIHPDSLIWAFPGWRPQLFKQLRRRGYKKIVIERVNSEISNANSILSKVTSRLGFPMPKGLDKHAIEIERLELEGSDYIFVCSPFVERSYLNIGVPRSKLIRCSYGWDPTKFPSPNQLNLVNSNPRFLFAGSGIVRKGLPDLLDIWSRVNPPARLRIVGTMDPLIAERYAKVLSRPDIEVYAFTNDIESHYRASHVFILPSHEEGSPLVTYTALGAGLASLVSSPGAGGIVRDNIEGLVRDPEDTDAFSEALLQLATDAQLRERLATAAKITAQRYTWARVAKARSEAFKGIMSDEFDATTIPWPADVE